MNASAADLAWREAWKRNIRQTTHKLFHAFSLQFRAQPASPAERVEMGNVPTFPKKPVSSVTSMLAEIRRLEKIETDILPVVVRAPTPRRKLPTTTDMPPIIELLPVQVRATSDLVGLAVRRFYERYQCLPNLARVSTLRYLSEPMPFYHVSNCEDIGCFSIEIEAAALPGEDVVECVNSWVGITEWYHL